MDDGCDMHIHTLVSDGEEEPLAMMRAVCRLGLRRISFTDHDAIGAYRHFSTDIFRQARSMDMELVTGIELDSDYRGRELHVLGYGFDLADGALQRYLERTQELRRQKIRLQIDIVNRHFKRLVVDPERVFLPHRDTLMKPHLVHAMLNLRLFTDYREAARWLDGNACVPVVIPKLAAGEAVSLIVQAGGQAVLAHPGFLVKEANLDLPALLAELIPAGLTGIEVEYPYKGTSPYFSSPEQEQEIVAELRRLAGEYRLQATRGSDAHTVAQLEAFHLPEKRAPN